MAGIVKLSPISGARVVAAPTLLWACQGQLLGAHKLVKIEFDPAKNDINRRKHGISLKAATGFD